MCLNKIIDLLESIHTTKVCILNHYLNFSGKSFILASALTTNVLCCEVYGLKCVGSTTDKLINCKNYVLNK